MRWTSGVIALSLAAAGCYRTRSFDVAEVERIEPLSGQRLSVLYTDGTTKTYEADRARVELRTGAEMEFEAPLSARVGEDQLRISNVSDAQSYSLREVDEIELEADAPGRPWEIAAATLGAAVLGGVIGAGTQSCNEEWGCLSPALAGFGGVLIGIPVGLALSIPLSGSLSRERAPRRPSADP